MIEFRPLTRVFLGVGACAAVAIAQTVPPEADAAARIIETAAIRAHVTFLADDLLEGRAA